MPLTDKPTRERICDLNDNFRKTLDPTLGRVMLAFPTKTPESGLSALSGHRYPTSWTNRKGAD